MRYSFDVSKDVSGQLTKIVHHKNSQVRWRHSVSKNVVREPRLIPRLQEKLKYHLNSTDGVGKRVKDIIKDVQKELDRGKWDCCMLNQY
jgi:hypothetical protein